MAMTGGTCQYADGERRLVGSEGQWGRSGVSPLSCWVERSKPRYRGPELMMCGFRLYCSMRGRNGAQKRQGKYVNCSRCVNRIQRGKAIYNSQSERERQQWRVKEKKSMTTGWLPELRDPRAGIGAGVCDQVATAERSPESTNRVVYKIVYSYDPAWARKGGARPNEKSPILRPARDVGWHVWAGGAGGAPSAKRVAGPAHSAHALTSEGADLA